MMSFATLSDRTVFAPLLNTCRASRSELWCHDCDEFVDVGTVICSVGARSIARRLVTQDAPLSGIKVPGREFDGVEVRLILSLMLFK